MFSGTTCTKQVTVYEFLGTFKIPNSKILKTPEIGIKFIHFYEMFKLKWTIVD